MRYYQYYQKMMSTGVCKVLSNLLLFMCVTTCTTCLFGLFIYNVTFSMYKDEYDMKTGCLRTDPSGCHYQLVCYSNNPFGCIFQGFLVTICVYLLVLAITIIFEKFCHRCREKGEEREHIVSHGMTEILMIN